MSNTRIRPMLILAAIVATACAGPRASEPAAPGGAAAAAPPNRPW